MQRMGRRGTSGWGPCKMPQLSLQGLCSHSGEQQGSRAPCSLLWDQLRKRACQHCSEAVSRGVSRQAATASASPSHQRAQRFGPCLIWGLRKASLVSGHEFPGETGEGSPVKFNSYQEAPFPGRGCLSLSEAQGSHIHTRDLSDGIPQLRRPS